jgi:hypothetical protein
LFTVLIPARYASTRLPGKPLSDIGGKPMVVRVAERARMSGAAKVVVATDDERIRSAVARYGIDVAMTRSDHPTGTDRLAESGYFRAKSAQEKLVESSSIPYSIVHATQFFEFIKGIADAATDGNEVHLPPVLIQPMAADDVATAVGRIAMGTPVNGTVEVAGPERFRLDELIRQDLSARNDPRHVVADPHARYFGAQLSERTLIPGDDARLGGIRFQEWLGQPASPSSPGTAGR